MTTDSVEHESVIFTVGHSNHPLAVFLDLLKTYHIEVLVDVRSRPYSRYARQYNRDSLKSEVADAGMKYLYLGNNLGGQPEGEHFYDAEGYVLYAKIAASPPFQKGIDRLQKGIYSYRIALMCSEEDPSGCHRHRLISRVLTERGITVFHIRGDGSVQSEDELVQEEAIQNLVSSQMSFWGGRKEDQWKSTQSVSHKKQPGSSSDS